MEATSTHAVNNLIWEGRFCDLKPRWHQDYKVTRVAGWIFLACSFASGCVTKVAATSFTARPEVVQYTVGGLGASTVGLACLAMFCLLKNCWKDPSFLEQEGKKFEKYIRDNNLSYRQINTHPIAAHLKFKDSEYNDLFRSIIMDDATSYESVKEKIMGTTTFGFTLDPNNCGRLKAKLLCRLQETKKYTLSDFEKSIFNITNAELDMNVCRPAYEQLENKTIDYAAFLDKIESRLCAMKTGFAPVVWDTIRTKAIEWYITNNLGAAKAARRTDAIALSITIKDLAAAGALTRDLQNICYKTFRNRHSTESFAYLSPEDLNKVQQAFLSSYKIMREHLEDAAFFGLNGDDLLRPRFDEEMKKITKFEQIADLLGTSVFSDGFLKKSDPQLRKLIINYLKEATYQVDKTSPLNAFDLMESDISVLVESAKQQNSLVNEIFQEQEKILVDNHQRYKKIIEREHSDAKRLTLIDGQGILARSTRELREIGEKISQCRAHMALLRKQETNALEEQQRLQDQIKDIQDLPILKAEQLKLNKELSQKSNEIETAKTKLTTGLAEANAHKANQKKLNEELTALKNRASSLEQKIRAAENGNEITLQNRLETLSKREKPYTEDNKELQQWIKQEAELKVVVERDQARITALEQRISKEQQEEMKTFEDAYKNQVAELSERKEDKLREIQRDFCLKLEKLTK